MDLFVSKRISPIRIPNITCVVKFIAKKRGGGVLGFRAIRQAVPTSSRYKANQEQDYDDDYYDIEKVPESACDSTKP